MKIRRSSLSEINITSLGRCDDGALNNLHNHRAYTPGMGRP